MSLLQVLLLAVSFALTPTASASTPTFLLLAVCFALTPTASASTPTLSLTVDPHAPHSTRSVFATLAEAQVELRSHLAAHNGAADVEVVLSPGSHRVPLGGLILTAADSPAPGHRVTWRGAAGREFTSVTGGANVSGWTLLNDPTLPSTIVTAPAPPELLDTSRQLYVDGVRAKRTSRDASTVLPGFALEDRAECPSCSYSVSSSTPLLWSNPSDIEFVWQGVASGWSESRCAVLSISTSPTQEPNCTIDPSNEPDCGFFESTEAQCVNNKTTDHPLGCCWHDGGIPPSGHYCVAPAFPGEVNSTRVALKQPCMWNLVNRPFQPYGGAAPTVVENVREHLDTPGQWYHDRAANSILYYPLPGQVMTSVIAVIPVEEALLSLQGAARHSVANLTFEHATWLRPSKAEGIVDQQSAAANICSYGVMPPAIGCGADDTYIVPPGNVALYGALDVDFFGCAFRHLGAYGASARGGSQNVSFRYSIFSDISAGAVMLGDAFSYNITDTAQWDANMLVSDCEMEGAVELSGATTVFIAYVENATVEHCLLYNASYSSFTLGWGWGREASRRGNNHITGNRILGSQLGRCCDGGGIYTLGPQPASSITNNYIAQGDAAWGPHAGQGIYHDNGSAGFTDTGNVIDGDWSNYYFQDDSLGPYGPGALCPDRNGQPTDCGMAFVGNWYRTDAPGTTSHVNTTIANNTHVAPGSILPPDAQAIVDASGPRY